MMHKFLLVCSLISFYVDLNIKHEPMLVNAISFHTIINPLSWYWSPIGYRQNSNMTEEGSMSRYLQIIHSFFPKNYTNINNGTYSLQKNRTKFSDSPLDSNLIFARMAIPSTTTKATTTKAQPTTTPLITNEEQSKKLGQLWRQVTGSIIFGKENIEIETTTNTNNEMLRSQMTSISNIVPNFSQELNQFDFSLETNTLKPNLPETTTPSAEFLLKNDTNYNKIPLMTLKSPSIQLNKVQILMEPRINITDDFKEIFLNKLQSGPLPTMVPYMETEKDLISSLTDQTTTIAPETSTIIEDRTSTTTGQEQFTLKYQSDDPSTTEHALQLIMTTMATMSTIQPPADETITNIPKLSTERQTTNNFVDHIESNQNILPVGLIEARTLYNTMENGDNDGSFVRNFHDAYYSNSAIFDDLMKRYSMFERRNKAMVGDEHNDNLHIIRSDYPTELQTNHILELNQHFFGHQPPHTINNDQNSD